MTARNQVLARAAAARLHAAACRGQLEPWNDGEYLHAMALTQGEARTAAAPLLAVCAQCPVQPECRDWAQVDKYTGIAAGSAWADGVQAPAHWVPGHPPRRMAG
jgi:hypothetical protein